MSVTGEAIKAVRRVVTAFSMMRPMAQKDAQMTTPQNDFRARRTNDHVVETEKTTKWLYVGNDCHGLNV